MKKTSVLTVCASALLLGSCSYVVPAIFVNATDAAVVIRFETLRPITSNGSPAKCEHVRQPPQTRPIAVTGWNWDDEQWSPAARFKFDADSCITELRVAAHSSAWIHSNGMCDDYEQYVSRNPAVRPPFESFQVVSQSRPVLLKGWDTAKAFKRSFKTCIFRFD